MLEMSLTYPDLYIRKKINENTLFSFWLYTRKPKIGWILNSNPTVFSKYISFCIIMNDLIFLAYHRTTWFVSLVQWSHNYLGYFKWIFNLGYEGLWGKSSNWIFFPKKTCQNEKIWKKTWTSFHFVAKWRIGLWCMAIGNSYQSFL